jgi:hypothetical protein
VCRAHATHAAVSPRARRAPARATDTPSRRASAVCFRPRGLFRETAFEARAEAFLAAFPFRLFEIARV